MLQGVLAYSSNAYTLEAILNSELSNKNDPVLVVDE